MSMSSEIQFETLSLDGVNFQSLCHTSFISFEGDHARKRCLTFEETRRTLKFVLFVDISGVSLDLEFSNRSQ